MASPKAAPLNTRTRTRIPVSKEEGQRIRDTSGIGPSTCKLYRLNLRGGPTTFTAFAGVRKERPSRSRKLSLVTPTSRQYTVGYL